MLRAVIVDDEQPAIDLLKILLENTGDITCVGEFCKPSEVAEKVSTLRPDVVFLDIEMPGSSGLELAAEILDQVAHTDIVFVTAFREYAVEAFELNAVDYLLKPALPEQVARTTSRLLEKSVVRMLQQENKIIIPLCQTGLTVNSLGKLEVRKSVSSELVKWRTAKVEELFFYLLHYRGTVVRKGEILESLWPECEPKRADTNLYTTVYKLKKTLKEEEIAISIEFVSGGYRLQIDDGMVYDVERFLAFAAEEPNWKDVDYNDLENRLALYNGDYLEGKDYLWCLTERTRLQKIFSTLVKQTASSYIQAAQYTKAENILLKQVSDAPYDEDSYELLLRISALRQDRPGMILHYEQLQEILQKDLEIKPRSSLTRLYERMLSEF